MSTNEDEIADEDLIDPALVIEPPSEMKTIIEKTVSFVVKNGIEFESKVRDSQRSNRKFDFLKPTHAFYNYYKHKYQISKYPKAAALAEQYALKKAELHSSQQTLLGIDENKNNNNNKNKNNKNTGVITHKLTLKQRIMQQLALHRKAKPEHIIERRKYNKFVVPLPTKRITAYEIDVIKLVAQFTACHGKSFIRDLQRGEPENETFGFLSPMHPRFQYFQRLIDAYSNIIDEFEDYSHNKRSHRDNKRQSKLQCNLDRDKIWYAAIGSAEWTNREKEKEAKYLANEENERRANALIDWQSFTVLDSIDFESDDVSHLVPPGKTIEEIDAILESTMDVEADINDMGLLAHDMEQDMDISDNSDSDMEQDSPVAITIPVIEMEKEKSELHRKQIAKAKVAVKLNSKPMPAPKGVIISNDLDVVPTQKMETEQDIELRLKLEKILNDSRNEQLENQQCPICGQSINIQHLSQHIRIELLDPKWKEQKESLKLKLSQTTLASNQQISENLIRFNQAQNPIHQKQNLSNRSDIIPWNGHKDSLPQQKKLKAVEEELKKQEKLLKQKENNNNNETVTENNNNNNQITNINPNPNPPPPPQAHAQAPYQHMAMSHPPQQYLNPMMINNAQFRVPPHARAHVMPPPQMLPPHHPMHHRPPVPPFAHAMHAQMGYHRPPPPPHAHAHAHAAAMNMQNMRTQAQAQPPPPPNKKMKLNNNTSVAAKPQLQPDGLIEEHEFIQQNGGIGKSVKIRILVPKNEKKKQFNFNGQMLAFTMQLNQSINELKQRINSVLTLPMNKQKLRVQSNGIWVKDANSLAFYNINAASILELAARTRGGKKNK